MKVLAALAQLAMAAGQTALPMPVDGDFDRDGRRDVAAVARRADKGYDIVIRRGIGGTVAVARVADPRTIFFTVLPDGTLSYGTARGAQTLVRWVDGRFTVTSVAG